MRKLSEQEIDQVKRAIAAKDLTSAEILVEIYDHYVSHLESFSEADFEKELFELEQKFTYGYCHSLQEKFNKQIRQEVGKMHWKVIQRNLRLPRIIYILAFMSVLFHLGSTFGNGKEASILIISQVLILKVFHIYFLINSSLRIAKIKKSINQRSSLQSAFFYPICERMYLPVMIIYSIVWLCDMMIDTQVFSNLTPQVASVFSILLFIYVISLVEVWKIKSKSALI